MWLKKNPQYPYIILIRFFSRKINKTMRSFPNSNPGPFPALSLQTAYCQAAAVRHFSDGRAKRTVRRSCITSGTEYEARPMFQHGRAFSRCAACRWGTAEHEPGFFPSKNKQMRARCFLQRKRKTRYRIFSLTISISCGMLTK